jgi:hypothetical protein
VDQVIERGAGLNPIPLGAEALRFDGDEHNRRPATPL